MTQCPRIFISVKQLPVCVQILADIDSRTLCHSSIYSTFNIIYYRHFQKHF